MLKFNKALDKLKQLYTLLKLNRNILDDKTYLSVINSITL